MLHTKFRRKSAPRFRRRKILKGYYHIYRRGGHLGHVTRIMFTNFHFLVPESFHTKFVSEWPSSFKDNLFQNGPVVSEKIQFEFLYVHDLGPRSSNDLDLQYSHTFMKSISCLYLPTFRSQASTVSEKSTVFTFSYRKA